MTGSLADAFGPACFLFLRPILVVACVGGSYLGFSFFRQTSEEFNNHVVCMGAHLLVFLILLVTARRVASKARLLITLRNSWLEMQMTKR